MTLPSLDDDSRRLLQRVINENLPIPVNYTFENGRVTIEHTPEAVALLRQSAISNADLVPPRPQPEHVSKVRSALSAAEITAESLPAVAVLMDPKQTVQNQHVALTMLLDYHGDVETCHFLAAGFTSYHNMSKGLSQNGKLWSAINRYVDGFMQAQSEQTPMIQRLLASVKEVYPKANYNLVKD